MESAFHVGTTDGELLYANSRLTVSDGDPLSILAAGANIKAQVTADHYNRI